MRRRGQDLSPELLKDIPERLRGRLSVLPAAEQPASRRHAWCGTNRLDTVYACMPLPCLKRLLCLMPCLKRLLCLGAYPLGQGYVLLSFSTSYAVHKPGEQAASPACPPPTQLRSAVFLRGAGIA